MTNTLIVFRNLLEEVKPLIENFDVPNKMNQMGNALEYFVRDLYLQGNNKRFSDYDIFSYMGNQNNPPDIILRGGDAIEVKKLQSNGTQNLPLNSSYPKKYFFNDDSYATKKAKECEGGNWSKKDILYIVGTVLRETEKVNVLWFVYGDCYCADREIYTRIKNTITTGIDNLGIETTATKEIAKVKKIDPLGITDLRVRGMWSIEHPAKVFSYLNLPVSHVFHAHLIMSKRKFDSFLDDDKELFLKKDDHFLVQETLLKDPDNPANRIPAIVASICK